MKPVRDTSAGKALSAWIILDPAGLHVATVQAHFGGSGVARVDVYQKDGSPRQQGRAGGYGYDKLTSALSGMTIDGQALTNHCSREGAPKRPEGSATYPDDMLAPLGYHFANGRRDCYREAGLDYLKALGYRVIQAI